MATSHNPLRLSDPAVLLLAANLTSVPQLASLQALIAGYPDVLHFSAVLELLLKILPETISPEDYVTIVYRSYRRETEQFNPSRIATSFIDEVSSLSQQALKRKLGLFNLLNLPQSIANAETEEKLLTQWFFDRARRVEEATGMIDLARRLVLPDSTNFIQTPPFPPVPIQLWGRGIVQVLETFIFDNDDEDELQLLSFESLDPDSAVRLLLSRTTPETVSRNIRNLILPFVEYIHSKEPGKEIWGTVWEWLLDRATAGEVEYVSNLGSDWIESNEGLLRDFLRTCLIACYLSHHSSPTIRNDLHRIHVNISHLSQTLNIQSASEQIILGHPETDLLASQLRNSSPLTLLTASSFKFLEEMITSADIIAQSSVGPELSLRELVTIREGFAEAQIQLVDRHLRNEQFWKKRNEEQWRKLRQSLKWLQSQSRVLGKISEVSLDTMILTALLDASGIFSSNWSDISIWNGKGYLCPTSGLASRYSRENYSRSILSLLRQCNKRESHSWWNEECLSNVFSQIDTSNTKSTSPRRSKHNILNVPRSKTSQCNPRTQQLLFNLDTGCPNHPSTNSNEQRSRSPHI